MSLGVPTENKQGQIAEELEKLEQNINLMKECLKILTEKLDSCTRERVEASGVRGAGENPVEIVPLAARIRMTANNIDTIKEDITSLTDLLEL